MRCKEPFMTCESQFTPPSSVIQSSGKVMPSAHLDHPSYTPLEHPNDDPLSLLLRPSLAAFCAVHNFPVECSTPILLWKQAARDSCSPMSQHPKYFGPESRKSHPWSPWLSFCPRSWRLNPDSPVAALCFTVAALPKSRRRLLRWPYLNAIVSSSK